MSIAADSIRSVSQNPRAQQFLLVLMVFAGFAFSLRKSVNTVVIILFLWALKYLYDKRGNLPALAPVVKFSLVLMVSQFFLTLLLWPIQGELNVGQLDENMRYAFGAVAFMVVGAHLLARHVTAFLVAFCASILWVIVEHHAGLAEGENYSILLNLNTAGLFGSVAVSLLGGLLLFPRFNHTQRAGLAMAFSLAVYLLVTSQTRSAWVAGLAGLSLLFFISLPTWKIRLALIAAMVAVVTVLAMKVELVATRYQATVSGFSDWQSGQNPNTSVGVRIDLYRGALKLAMERPVQGYSHTQQLDAVKQRGKTELYQTDTSQYVWLVSGVHNQYLDRFITHGALGLLLSLSIYVLPILLFLRYQRQARSHEDPSLYPLLLLGFCSGLCYLINGLSLNLGYKYICSFMAFSIAMSLVAVQRLHQGDQAR